MAKKGLSKRVFLFLLGTILLLNQLPLFVLGQTKAEQAYSSYKTIIERAQESGNAIEMPLEKCIQLALKKNLDIEINRYQPFINQQQLKAALGVYDFNIDSQNGYRKTERPITSTINSFFVRKDTFTSTSYFSNTTLSKYLPTGANVSVTLDNTRDASSTNLFNPTFNGNFSVSGTQPLWRNFRIDSQRRSIMIAKKDNKISEVDFENQVSNTIKSVEDAYWDLVNAIEQQKIKIQSRDLALIQLRDNEKRVKIGTLAPITITQTKAEVAQAEQGVIAAEASIIRTENSLKNLITNNHNDLIWQKIIIPTDKPTITEKIYSVDEALKLASRKRPEVRKLSFTMEKDDIDIKFYKNQTKPQLDLTASYTAHGVAGPNIRKMLTDDQGNPIYDDNGNPIFVETKFTGSIGTVYKQIFEHKYLDYNVSLNFKYTFGNHAAKANLAVAKINKRRDMSTLRKTMQSIKVEILNAIQTIQVNKKNLESAIVARQFQEEQLDGQTKRFQAGLTTNFEVLQAQRDLANARAAELSARIALKKSIVDLYKATFTNIDKHQIQLAMGGGNFGK